MRKSKRSPAVPQITVGDRTLDLTIRRHPRSRHLRLRVDAASRTVTVTMPSYARTGEAVRFAEAQRDWIAQALDKAGETLVPTPGAAIPLRGTPHRIVWQDGASRTVHIGDGEIRLGGPQAMVPQRIVRWCKAELRRLAQADLDDYLARAGEKPVKLALSGAGRRWGSCSSSGTIRINWRLIFAPDAVRRSVVAHEVAHLRHMDHSAQFYGWLDTLFEGDRKAADRWLKQHGRSLYMVSDAAPG